jgi:hypothetical protein
MPGGRPTHLAPRRTAVLGATVLGLLLVAACSSSDDEGSTRARHDDGPSRTTTSTSDSGAEREVAAAVRNLLDGYNDAVNTIIADPTVVRDRKAEVVRSYLDLFEPGSQIPQNAIAGWTGMANDGSSIKPINAEHRAVVVRLDGEAQATAPDQLRIPICEEHRYLELDGNGQVRDMVRNTLRPGEIVAARIDGQWRIRELKTFVDGQACTTPSEGT